MNNVLINETKKETIRIGPFKDFIASGVKIGNTIYLSGQVSLDTTGQLVGKGDLVAQMCQCYANAEEVLAKYGATLANMVDETWLVTDIEAVMAQAEPLFTTRAEMFGGNPDVTQTAVQIAGLVMPELLIEIKCVAQV